MIVKRQQAYQKGLWAEKEAAQYFRKAGYKILEERYKTKFGEIDIVVQKSDLLVFVEVKIRQDMDDSLYAITPKNRRRIEQAALSYLAEHPEKADFSMRFDVLAFARNTQNEGIWMEHLDNAWVLGA